MAMDDTFTVKSWSEVVVAAAAVIVVGFAFATSTGQDKKYVRTTQLMLMQVQEIIYIVCLWSDKRKKER